MIASPEPPPIPPELYARLVAARPYLETQGTVEQRREPDRPNSFRIRYRAFDPELGYTVQKCILVGDETSAVAIQGLLDQWRRERVQREKAEALAARLGRAHERARRGLLRRVAKRLRGTAHAPVDLLHAIDSALQEGGIMLLHTSAAFQIVGANRSN